MEIQLLTGAIIASDADIRATLAELWWRSVLATHHFVALEDLLAIRAELPELLKQVGEIWLATAGSASCGFLGCNGAEVEMLFVEPACFGRGIGSRLIGHAFGRHGPLTVTVNVQNIPALDFYTGKGFLGISSAPVDNQGRHYLVLYMKQTLC